MSAIATLVDCGGERHRLVWRDGELQAADHGDVDGERTLAVLGGTSCPCVEALDAWSRHADDLAVLSALTRGPAETIDRPRRPRTGWVGYAPLQARRPPYRSTMVAVAGRGRGGPAPGAEAPDDLEVLYGLGPALGSRLVAAVTRRCLERVAAGDAASLPALRASLAGRAGLALSIWSDGALPVRVETAAPDEPPSLRRDGDELVAALRLGWVADIWGRGLTSVGDRFVLDGQEGASGDMVLSGLSPDLERIEEIRVRIDGAGR